MINLNNIRQFLLDKWWTIQWESNFYPPEDLWFSNWFSLYVPFIVDERADIIKDIASLLGWVYELEKEKKKN